MAGEKASATFGVNLDGNAAEVSDETAASLDHLRTSIAGSTDSLKSMSGALRRLKGNTDDVKAAKDDLKKKIAAETAALTSAQIKIQKSGVSLEQLTAKSKKLAEQQEAAKASQRSFGDSAKAIGGPLGELKEKLGGLGELAKLGSSKLGALGLAVGGLAVVVVALTTAVISGAVAFGKWFLSVGDAARSANLLREAVAGSATNAAALGTQVDDLAKRIPLGKDAINDLAVTLAKSNVQGQTLVDTLNAVGQASAAAGDDVGATVKELVERGRISQRFQVNPQELQGKGLGTQFFQEIATELSSKMKVGVKDAQAALFEGRVKLADGAAALRAALEKKFGGINLRKSLSLDVLVMKAKENLREPREGCESRADFTGLQEALRSALRGHRHRGQGLKKVLTLFGEGIVKAFDVGIPLAKQFFQGLVIGALSAYVAYLELSKTIKDTFGKDVFKGAFDGLDIGESTMKALEVAAKGVGVAVALIVTDVKIIATEIGALRKAFKWLVEDLPQTIVSTIGGIELSNPRSVDRRRLHRRDPR